jgi:iron complex transport system substrate-binding protein
VRWVSELIEIAGGENVFADRAASPLARDRILADPLEVVERAPDDHHRFVVRQAFPSRARCRPSRLVRPYPQSSNGRLHEIKSAIILTPGPVAISEGLPLLLDILDIEAR